MFREALRVLKPGGRMTVSDLVLHAAADARAQKSVDLYVGCVAGASLRDDYLSMIRDAGFADVAVVEQSGLHGRRRCAGRGQRGARGVRRGRVGQVSGQENRDAERTVLWPGDVNVVQPSVRCASRFAAAAAVLVAAWLATPARAQPAPSEFALVDSLELDEPPHVIKRVDPVTARYVTEHIEGTVLVLARVGKDGLVREPRVLHSIPLLDSAAVRAARQWVFSPALRDGKPIAVWITIPIRFSADGRGPVPPEVQARRDHEAAQAAFDGGCAELRARAPSRRPTPTRCSASG